MYINFLFNLNQRESFLTIDFSAFSPTEFFFVVYLLFEPLDLDLIFVDAVNVVDFLECFRIPTMQKINKIAPHAQQITMEPMTMKTVAIVSESDDVKFSAVAVSPSSVPILCAPEQ